MNKPNLNEAVSLGATFDLSDIIGNARASIDTKHTSETQSAYDSLITEMNDGYIKFGVHGVDMTREKDAEGKLIAMEATQSGARVSKAQGKKHIGNAMTKNDSDLHMDKLVAMVKGNSNYRVIGWEKDGKHGWKILVQDVSGTKSTIQVQQEHLDNHGDEIDELVKAGDVQSVLKFIHNLVHI